MLVQCGYARTRQKLGCTTGCQLPTMRGIEAQNVFEGGDRVRCAADGQHEAAAQRRGSRGEVRPLCRRSQGQEEGAGGRLLRQRSAVLPILPQNRSCRRLVVLCDSGVAEPDCCMPAGAAAALAGQPRHRTAA